MGLHYKSGTGGKFFFRQFTFGVADEMDIKLWYRAGIRSLDISARAIFHKSQLHSARHNTAHMEPGLASTRIISNCKKKAHIKLIPNNYQEELIYWTVWTTRCPYSRPLQGTTGTQNSIQCKFVPAITNVTIYHQFPLNVHSLKIDF